MFYGCTASESETLGAVECHGSLAPYMQFISSTSVLYTPTRSLYSLSSRLYWLT